MIPFQGNTVIPDLVFPLLHDISGNRAELIGTAFFIGKRGYALTAAHVIEQLTMDKAFGGFSDLTGTIGVSIDGFEIHPNEDVGIVYLADRQQQSWYRVVPTRHFGSAEYEVWGYPLEVAHETKHEQTSAGEIPLERPELIYTKGHIRRRISRTLPLNIYRGTSFYELSAVSGDGTSGAPMVHLPRSKKIHDVIGVYIGSKNNVGYAVRTDAIHDWRPKILGRSIREESEDASG